MCCSLWFGELYVRYLGENFTCDALEWQVPGAKNSTYHKRLLGNELVELVELVVK